MLRNLFFTLFIIVKAHFVSSELSCRNDQNKSVDWFIAMKYHESYEFVYLSSDTLGKNWIKSSYDVNDEKNMIAVTIIQSYLIKSDSFFAYYNDEPVGKTYRTSNRGHLKGVLNFDNKTGYWLIHSVPKFPSFQTYDYNEGEEVYAQSFICVTLSTSNLESIANQLLMMQATVYKYNLPTNFPFYNVLNAMVHNKYSHSHIKNVLIMNTVGRKKVYHYGKSKDFGQDLYLDLVAPELRSSIYVESWIRGNKVNTSCTSPYQVINVKKVKLEGAMPFKETQDHSKWAVSLKGYQKFVCIGDINRMVSQFKRGGGTLCISDDNIYDRFLPIVYDSDKC